MIHALEVHDCAKFLYELRGRRLGDTMPCRCGTHWTLRQLTRWLWLTPWRFHDSYEIDWVWVRDRASERAARRERILRERQERRG